ncbi:MAG: SoxR reducing system RseC family protein [Gammaproteobacteria bacterium]|nr:SoxR reducing system RseC family protein [Gammaproteobacteria bacterium]
MIEKTATVIRLEGQLAVLTVARQSACDSCSANKGCGTSVLAKLFGRSAEFRAYNKIDAVPGQTVTVAIPEAVLVKTSLMMYLLPLVLMLVFAIVGQAAGSSSGLSELLSVLFGIAGFAAGIGLFRIFAGRLQADVDNLPVLTRQSTPIGVTIALPERQG